MASRRHPLAAVPNAVNSPIRSVASLNGKRTRAQAGDTILGQPPTKKHIIEASTNIDGAENVDPRRRNAVAVIGQDKLDEPFSRRSNASQPTALERKFASARERKTTPQSRTTERSQKYHADNVESIRQWQKHYRRQFPSFVFYFDNVGDDIRHKAMRQIISLGAREEKFFSKAVTHVITTRQIPSEATSTSVDDEGKYESKYDAVPMDPAPSTTISQRRTTNLLDANIQRRSQPPAALAQPNIDNRKTQPHSADILCKARALGIKIWALEKLQRVLSTILEPGAGDQAADHRSHTTSRTSTRVTQNADLEQLLRHEKVRGPADRDMNVATQDMVALRGCYIYIHDMDEKTKPVMVRDYPKPQSKEEGKWPQFRLSAAGRCPFVEDLHHAKKLAQQEAQAAKAQALDQRRTRGSASLLAQPPQILTECEGNLRRSPRKLAQASKPELSRTIKPPPAPTVRQSSAEVLPAFFNSAAANMRGMPRMVGGEPVASGMQRSNVTSAIRSQAISSAAISSTAPGLQRRVGDTKEVSLLKRKVLASNHGVPSSYANDVRAAINDDQAPPPRAAKRKAQETLGVVHEGDEHNDDRARTSAPKRKRTEKEAKPGYCENCRDKYDDFDEVSPNLCITFTCVANT